MTAAFALAMLMVLAAVAGFVYGQVRANLNESIDAGLRARAADLAALAERSGSLGGSAAVEPEEAFAQLFDSRGRLLGRYGGAREPALTPAEVSGAPLEVERRVRGVNATSRMLARPVDGRRVVVAGVSLEDRDETLAGLVTAFAVAGPLAVAGASLLGWLLAGAGLAPMEAMRRRAEQISLSSPGERLPLPAARDEIRRLGETLNDMLARLEASFERERRFVTDASHELRTPLTVLKAEIETALSAAAGDPAAREALAAALREVDQLAQLAEDLLLVARAAGGAVALEAAPVALSDLLEQARTRFAARATAEGREIAVDAAAGVVAEADPLRMRQALSNLLDNALRYGSGTVRLAGWSEDGEVVLGVYDEGGGIPAELSARAFERFARGRDARGSGGAGLGLAIVRAIAEAHGGSAAVSGGGVEIRLPLSSPSQAPRPE